MEQTNEQRCWPISSSLEKSRGGNFRAPEDPRGIGLIPAGPERLRRAPTIQDYLAVSLLQLAYALHWGALLGIVIQERVEHFVAPERKGWALALVMLGGGVVSTAVQIGIGVISDRTRSRWGRRLPYILAGIVFTIPFLYLLGRATSYNSVFVAFLGIQFFLNVSMGPYQALIPDLIHPTHHGRASAFLGLTNILGQTVGVALPGLILGKHPKILVHFPLETRLLFLMLTLAAVLLLFGVLTAFLFPRWAFDDKEVITGEGLEEVFRLRIRENPDFYWLLASRFVFNLGFYTATAFLLYYVRDTLGVGERAEQAVSILMLLATLFSLAGVIPSGILSDRMSKITLIFISAGITGAGALIFVTTSSLSVAFAAGIAFGIGWGAFSAVDWALACNLLPPKRQAKFMGIWSFAYTVPQMLAPALLGRLADYANHEYGMGVGWRLAIAFILLYLLAGTYLIRFVRERPVHIPS
jgi:MFS family permease